MKKIITSLLAFSMIFASGCTIDQTKTEVSVSEEKVEVAQKAEETKTEQTEKTSQQNSFNVVALSGPTAMGMLDMIDANEENNYEILGAPDEAVAKIVSGQADIAAVPANLAATLYNKTEGQVSVIAINTLGVLYVVENGDSINSISDLEGKTIYATGQGATPEYGLRHILDKAEVSDVSLEFKTESAEILALFENDKAEVAVLPQPFVTAALASNENLRVALDLNEEWGTYSDGQMITGVLVARNEIIEQYKDDLDVFLANYEKSVEVIKTDVDSVANLCEEYGILKAGVAKKAIPECNIVCITDEQMATDLSNYLQVLFDQNPKSIGGKLPDENFYYQK